MAAPCCSLVLIPLQADGYLEVLGEGPGREKSTRLSKLDLSSFTCSQELTFLFSLSPTALVGTSSQSFLLISQRGHGSNLVP